MEIQLVNSPEVIELIITAVWKIRIFLRDPSFNLQTTDTYIQASDFFIHKYFNMCLY